MEYGEIFYFYSNSFPPRLESLSNSVSLSFRPCPAWQRRASTCGRALLPHADKHMFLYVLELCKSEAKRAGPLGIRSLGHPVPTGHCKGLSCVAA
jgi:hypothetical protein